MVYDTKYHLVWMQKFRKWVQRQDIPKRVLEIFSDIAAHHGFEIQELRVAPEKKGVIKMLDFTFVFDLLNEEQKSLVALMKEFCQREVDRKRMNELADKPVPPNATKKDLMDRIPWDIISKAHDVGLRQVAVPKEYGGGGYGDRWITMHALAEAAGYYGGKVGRLFTLPWKHCSTLCYAPKPIQDEFFPAFMKNRKTLFAASITEPDHGSDLLMPYDDPSVGKTIGYKDKDEWVINGEKMFCTAGGVSDYIILSVRTDKNAKISKAMTTFLCPTNTPGFSVRRVNDMMGNEVPSNTQFLFENCRIPDRLRMTPVNGAYEEMRSRLAGKSLHFMTFLGESQWEWEQMRDYAKKRIQGGKPIIQHPNIGMLIAEGDCLLRTLRLLIYQDAWDCDRMQDKQGLVSPLGWWYVNFWYKKVIYRLIEIGHEVYGGMAPQKELPFENWVRVNMSILHGGSTGSLSLVKASKIL